MLHSSSQKWFCLFIACFCILLSGLDITAVNIILAPLATEFHISLASTQWVVNAYLLSSAACLVAGGRLGDIYGQKTILLYGLVLFLLGSFFAASSSTYILLVLARCLQGIGAALISPSSMALLYQTFPDEQKGTISGIITGIMSASFTLGPFFGGTLAHLYSWRLVFLINVPLVLITILCTFLIKNSESRKLTFQGIDVLGILFIGIFLFSLISFFDLMPNVMQHKILFASLGFIMIISFLSFIYNEFHTINPILKIDLFRNRVIAIGSMLRFLFAIPIAIFTFLLALYLQRVFHYNPLKAGLLFIPFSLTMVASSPYAGKLVDKKGYKMPLIVGIIICIATYLGLAILGRDANLLIFIILFALGGIGFGFTRPGLITAIMVATPKEHLGLMNSIFTMLNSLGASIGIALAAVVLGFYSSLGSYASLLYVFSPIMYFCVFVFILILLLIRFGLKEIVFPIARQNRF